MGWAGGSEVCSRLIALAKKHVPESCRAKFYAGVIDILEYNDCDTLGECLEEDPIFDKVMKKRNPEWFEHDDGAS